MVKCQIFNQVRNIKMVIALLFLEFIISQWVGENIRFDIRKRSSRYIYLYKITEIQGNVKL
jgi:hypothetical protein